jgi:hypothetical protein
MAAMVFSAPRQFGQPSGIGYEDALEQPRPMNACRSSIRTARVELLLCLHSHTWNSPMTLIRSVAALFILAVSLGGCVVYEPVPVDPMEAPWRAAVGAIEDAGLTVVTADRPTGTVRGARGSVEGTILVRMRNDGRVGVEISSRDPDRRDPGLTQRLTDAYNRRMGR